MNPPRNRSPWIPTLAVLAALVAGGAFWVFWGGSSPSFQRGGTATTRTGSHGQTGHGALHEGADRFLRRGDSSLLDSLLPQGITEISGSGGKGLNRQVRAHGLWFPVFNLSKAGPEGAMSAAGVQLTQVPLMITNPHPPPGVVHEPLEHVFTAVGGVPPYQWAVEMPEEADGFQLDSTTGAFSGLSESPLQAAMNVYVTDAAGAQASAATTLAIGSSTPLQLLTTSLPAGTVGQEYNAALRAEGGTPPYTWSLETLSTGWTCAPSTGAVTASLTSPGEHDLHITLADMKSSVQSTLKVRVSEGLEITTPSPLPPAAPGSGYSGTFEAMGGTPPYRWALSAGSLPAGWILNADGSLAGTAPPSEAQHEFSVEVTDADGRTYQKPYELSISRGLLAIPSREKCGLAWSYNAMERTLGAKVAGASLRRNGLEIYRGTNNNWVDRNLPTGTFCNYELTALTTDGRALAYASAVATIVPITMQRAKEGVSGDPYADRVVSFSPLSAQGYGAASLPANVLGPPDGSSTFTPAHLPQHLVSLHASTSGGGAIVLEFTNNILESGPGLDVTVFENVIFQGNDPNKRFMEPAVIEVALFEGEWHRLPFRVTLPAEGGTPDLKQPAYYAQGFAGVNATTGEDPTDPTRSGGDSFDLSSAGAASLTWFRFIRLRATGDQVLLDAAGLPVRHTSENAALSGTGSSGFDLDAISAINF